MMTTLAGLKYPNDRICPKKKHEYINSGLLWINPNALRVKFSECIECEFYRGSHHYYRDRDKWCYIDCTLTLNTKQEK